MVEKSKFEAVRAKDYLRHRNRYGVIVSGWRCPLCGKVNGPYVAECSCNEEISQVTYSLDRLIRHASMKEYHSLFGDLVSFWNKFGLRPKKGPEYYKAKKISKTGLDVDGEAFVVHHEEFTCRNKVYTYDLYSDGSTVFKGFNKNRLQKAPSNDG